MKDIIEKLSSYNIFNYLLPGVLFAGIGEVATSRSLIHDDIVIGLFFYYFYGLVISRIGSMILEPLLKRIELVKYAPYKDYLFAVKIDSKIDTLSESNNQYRTLSALFLSLMLLAGYDALDDRIPISEYAKLLLLFLILLVLFVCAYRKQTAYISSRVANAKSQKPDE